MFSCGDNTIHFWDLKLNKHLLTINTICQTYQLILLSNNRLLDCYYFNSDIYKADRPYNNIPLMKKVLHSKNNEIYSIQYLKKNRRNYICYKGKSYVDNNEHEDISNNINNEIICIM